jgi:hypothetical protein
MKIYLALKFHADFRNRKLIEEISERLSLQGHEVVHRVASSLESAR